MNEEQAEAIVEELIDHDVGVEKAPVLFLDSLRIENFRAIKDAEFFFQPGLNVIIGANNSAKSALIDGLRILLNIGTFEKKEDFIRLKSTDVYIQEGDVLRRKTVSFTATFYGKEDTDVPAQFYDMLTGEDAVEIKKLDNKKYVKLLFRYSADLEYSNILEKFEVVSTSLKGGHDFENPVTYQTLDQIRSIYLAPLRDLVNDRAKVGSEIEKLLLSYTPLSKEADRKKIPQELKTKAQDLIKEITENKHESAASKNLAEYTKPYAINDSAISFVPSGISDELFRTLLPVFTDNLHGVSKLPLISNGLGINQLIYASIVLSRRGESETDSHIRKFFLIEEPEAHLHPQLQDSFFHVLNNITDNQIFVTSHSPTITAKTDIEKMIVMQSGYTNPDEGALPLHLSEIYSGDEAESHRRYLHKFLDVTRSHLLFAKGAIFVEGITEAMLLQKFSEVLDCSLRDNAIEIIILDSNSGYDHFKPIFSSELSHYGRAVLITDSDVKPADVKSDTELLAGYDGGFDEELAIDENTATAVGYGTLELGLLRAAANAVDGDDMKLALQQALKKAVKGIVQPDDEDKFVSDFLDFDKPSLAYKKMKESKQGVHVSDESLWQGTWRTNAYFRKVKADFAMFLSDELEAMDPSKIVVPPYIEQAIKFVVCGDTTPEARKETDGEDDGADASPATSTLE